MIRRRGVASPAQIMRGVRASGEGMPETVFEAPETDAAVLFARLVGEGVPIGRAQVLVRREFGPSVSRTPEPECGTSAGVARHRRRREEKCRLCLDWDAEARAGRRAEVRGQRRVAS